MEREIPKDQAFDTVQHIEMILTPTRLGFVFVSVT